MAKADDQGRATVAELERVRAEIERLLAGRGPDPHWGSRRDKARYQQLTRREDALLRLLHEQGAES